MSKFPIEIEGVSAVLAGSMNPAIFHPEWFFRNELISEAELGASSVEIIHPDVAVVSVASLRVDVRKDKLQVTGGPGESRHVRDIVVQVFRLLSHTPITGVGINRNMHVRCPTREAVDSIGHALAPKSPWDGLLEKPGTRVLSVEGRRPGYAKAVVLVTVEPSVRVANGVYVSTNAHHEIDGGASEAVEILDAEWDDLQIWSRDVAMTLLERTVAK